MSELPTGTVTLLLADIEGSTRLWEADARGDDGCRRAPRPHSDGSGGVRTAVCGRSSKVRVTALWWHSPAPTDAVACALKLQQAPFAPLRLRIGLHTGEVRLRDEGNYIGPTINRTARLRDLAHGGQTVLLRRHRGIGVRTAARKVHGWPISARIGCAMYRVRNGWRSCAIPIFATSSLRCGSTKASALQRLPAQLTSFVGRESEMAEVRQLLARATGWSP